MTPEQEVRKFCAAFGPDPKPSVCGLNDQRLARALIAMLDVKTTQAESGSRQLRNRQIAAIHAALFLGEK